MAGTLPTKVCEQAQDGISRRQFFYDSFKYLCLSLGGGQQEGMGLKQSLSAWFFSPGLWFLKYFHSGECLDSKTPSGNW